MTAQVMRKFNLSVVKRLGFSIEDSTSMDGYDRAGLKISFKAAHRAQITSSISNGSRGGGR